MMLFVGWADDEYFCTGHRNIPELRKRAKDPIFFVNADEAKRLDMTDGDWARITTSTGSIVSRVYTRSGMPKGLIRVAHGWWKPESPGGLDKMSGMGDFSDAVITADDDPELIDTEQGGAASQGHALRAREDERGGRGKARSAIWPNRKYAAKARRQGFAFEVETERLHVRRVGMGRCRVRGYRAVNLWTYVEHVSVRSSAVGLCLIAPAPITRSRLERRTDREGIGSLAFLNARDLVPNPPSW